MTLQMMAYLWLAEKEGLEVNIETTRMPGLVGVAAQVIHHPNEVLNGRPPFRDLGLWQCSQFELLGLADLSPSLVGGAAGIWGVASHVQCHLAA